MDNDADLGWMEKFKDVLSSARINAADLLDCAQSIEMDTHSHDDLFLMQLSPEMLNNFTAGQIMTIKGEPDDSAVLCSESRTFEIKEADISNSLLLLPSLQFPDDITVSKEPPEKSSVLHQKAVGVFQKYFDLKQCNPRLMKLRQFLEKCPFQGGELEPAPGEKYTFRDLLKSIQASEEELKCALDKMHACEINGYIRLLDCDYKFRVLSHVLDAINSESLPTDKFSKPYIIELLESLEPREVLEKCFSWYCSQNGVDENGSELYRLNEDEVCRLHAEILLKNAGRFHLQEFLQSWQKSVPEYVTTNLKQLQGLAVRDLTSRPEVIFYFPAHDLPENINERLSKLFQTKPKWADEEIMPYIRNITATDMEAKAILTKHARSSVQNGVKMYSSKW